MEKDNKSDYIKLLQKILNTNYDSNKATENLFGPLRKSTPNNEKELSRLEKLQEEDYEERQKTRKTLTLFSIRLLIAQNLAIFITLIVLSACHEIEHLQILIGTVISGTLLETYGIMKVIAKFNFSEINYKSHNDHKL